ncbi:hypothetical protein [Paenibacillus alvei]|uniref:hypothetical protein n=1 Tax=Paenibacillus alvei TaxID=44250 RepID=UPI0013DABF38|nr:hypothetical protein [Paenibacillus alvei]NEZ40189.1 hypothetical protein [Paenibacillus alvei]
MMFTTISTAFTGLSQSVLLLPCSSHLLALVWKLRSQNRQAATPSPTTLIGRYGSNPPLPQSIAADAQ